MSCTNTCDSQQKKIKTLRERTSDCGREERRIFSFKEVQVLVHVQLYIIYEIISVLYYYTLLIKDKAR